MESDELAFAGVSRLLDLLRAKEVSARELTELFLGRIERLDPELNAFRRVFAERALTDADQADARRGAGDERPLLGLPLAVKDTEDVVGEVTHVGTDANVTPAAADNDFVGRLRAAGAVLIGKTNLPELAIMGTTEGPAFGVTRNPWDVERTPGGSSGGSAAAVAAGLVPAATASDGAGSIRIPAAHCGLVGLKPQRDRISLAPHREHWLGLSVVGFETRTVADTALLLDAVAASAPPFDGSSLAAAPASGSATTSSAAAPASGSARTSSAAAAPSARTPSSAAAGSSAPTSSSATAGPFAAAAARPPGRLRIAVSTRAPFPVPLDAEVRAAVDATAELLRSLGHAVDRREPSYGTASNAITPRYLRGIADDAAGVERPARLQRRTRGFARMGSLLPDRLVAAARRDEAAHAARINQVFEHADVLLTPVAARPPVGAAEWEGMSAPRTLAGMVRTYPYTSTWNMTGQPAISVPAPSLSRDGLPIGVQLIAPPGGELVLLSLAAQLEAEIGWPARRPPVS